MSYKKMLVIILIVILAMFSLMLTTSYAWYSYENGSTTFDAVTNSKDVEVTFLKGEYINNTKAVPIKSSDVAQYSDKHQFVVRTKNNTVDNEIEVQISLVDIAIDSSLRISDFKVELYHQGSKVSTTSGNTIGVSGATTKVLGSAVLDNQIDNNFEVRVYLLDNNGDQSSLMLKSFRAKIKVDVVSRLKTHVTNWDNPDIYVSAITIDGVASESLPTEGLYNMSASCSKGSTLTWDKLTKTITYASGSKVNDSCSLTFTKSTEKIYLNTVEPGSYVKYTGSNGCEGKACKGQNANYVSDTNMGYCKNSDFKFTVNGWRVGYIKDGNVYLVSAGAPECVGTYVESKSSGTSSQTLSANYYYGSGYTFDIDTGRYSLTGVTASTVAWSSSYSSIIANTPYTCKSTSSTGTCYNMYQVTSYVDTTHGQAYTYSYTYEKNNMAPNHMARLNKVALKYCNPKYADGGVCDSSSTWAMNANDFQNIVGKSLSSSSCYQVFSDRGCGYANDLIDNGGYYWYATPYSSTSTWAFGCEPGAYVFTYDSFSLLGVRPILRLGSSVLVVGGNGTYEYPYQLSI